MKTNLDSVFKLDEELVKNGVEFEWNGVVFKLRYMNASNPRVKAAFAAHYRPYSRQIELGTLDPGIELEIKMKLLIDICLVTWSGLEIDGQDAPYSPETALKLFKHLPECFEEVWKYANDRVNYKESLGNS